ncbi:SEC-C metal-binding domain-containing protein [Caryophanon tenue]|uniref:Metal-binding protein n=1 Tax=Caryophanon tenue TaxID=33978 RepID=A0A1C0Y7G2_9BACL|nr:SEC-C metal-binding domain-containing protein [Caryophanon tenue]OCS83090.1 metal-binding protein [Caryophanon tenue]
MIGRNDPCPCGSGKKYKKCCANNEAVTTTVLFEEELEQVLDTMFANYPERQDHRALIEHFQGWIPTLHESLSRELVEAISIDDFFFHQRQDIWLGHLDKMMKNFVRPATLKVLATWRQPEMFVGQVVAVHETFIEAKHILTGATVFIRRETDKPIPVDMFVFAFLLPDRTLEENHFLAISTLIFISDAYAKVFKAYAKDFDGEDVFAFFAKNHLALWQKLVAAGYNGEEFTEKEASVVNDLQAFLTKQNLQAEKLVELVEDFLVEKQPKARKTEAISAGAVRFAQEHDFFGGQSFTIKEISEHFEISASSLNKYAQELAAYYAEKQA